MVAAPQENKGEGKVAQGAQVYQVQQHVAMQAQAFVAAAVLPVAAAAAVLASTPQARSFVPPPAAEIKVESKTESEAKIDAEAESLLKEVETICSSWENLRAFFASLTPIQYDERMTPSQVQAESKFFATEARRRAASESKSGVYSVYCERDEKDPENNYSRFIVNIERDEKVEVVGDLHADYDGLKVLLRSILASDKTFFSGDLFDRGNESLRTTVLSLLLRERYPKKVFCVFGNHERFAIDPRIDLGSRLYNGFFGDIARCVRRVLTSDEEKWVMGQVLLPMALCAGGKTPNGKLFVISHSTQPAICGQKDSVSKVTESDETKERGGVTLESSANLLDQHGVSTLIAGHTVDSTLHHDFKGFNGKVRIIRGHATGDYSRTGYLRFGKHRATVTIYDHDQEEWCAVLRRDFLRQGVPKQLENKIDAKAEEKKEEQKAKEHAALCDAWFGSGDNDGGAEEKAKVLAQGILLALKTKPDVWRLQEYTLIRLLIEAMGGFYEIPSLNKEKLSAVIRNACERYPNEEPWKLGYNTIIGPEYLNLGGNSDVNTNTLEGWVDYFYTQESRAVFHIKKSPKSLSLAEIASILINLSETKAIVTDGFGLALYDRLKELLKKMLPSSRSVTDFILLTKIRQYVPVLGLDERQVKELFSLTNANSRSVAARRLAARPPAAEGEEKKVMSNGANSGGVIAARRHALGNVAGHPPADEKDLLSTTTPVGLVSQALFVYSTHGVGYLFNQLPQDIENNSNKLSGTDISTMLAAMLNSQINPKETKELGVAIARAAISLYRRWQKNPHYLATLLTAIFSRSITTLTADDQQFLTTTVISRADSFDKNEIVGILSNLAKNIEVLGEKHTKLLIIKLMRSCLKRFSNAGQLLAIARGFANIGDGQASKLLLHKLVEIINSWWIYPLTSQSVLELAKIAVDLGDAGLLQKILAGSENTFFSSKKLSGSQIKELNEHINKTLTKDNQGIGNSVLFAIDATRGVHLSYGELTGMSVAYSGSQNHLQPLPQQAESTREFLRRFCVHQSQLQPQPLQSQAMANSNGSSGSSVDHKESKASPQPTFLTLFDPHFNQRCHDGIEAFKKASASSESKEAKHDAADPSLPLESKAVANT